MFEFSQLAVPIVQAPMAGGLNTPQLAAAVANAGGVGSFGFAYTRADKIAEDLAKTRALTQGPINANFFVFQPVESPSKKVLASALQALSELPLEVSGELVIPTSPFFPDLEQQLDAVWAHPPEILTFHFGLPSSALIHSAHSKGICVGVSATNKEEGTAIEKAGADFIVAQGIEAGGHRGIFDPLACDSELPMADLVKQLVDATTLPIVAAGGLMTGQEIGGAIDLGAAAVQMGTAFLCCEEAGTSATYRQMLLSKEGRNTVYTSGFSGRRAQGIENQFIRLMENKPTLAFPIQNTLTGPIRKQANVDNDPEYQSLWAGRGYAKSRSMPVSELMQVLQSEMEQF